MSLRKKTNNHGKSTTKHSRDVKAKQTLSGHFRYHSTARPPPTRDWDSQHAYTTAIHRAGDLERHGLETKIVQGMMDGRTVYHIYTRKPESKDYNEMTPEKQTKYLHERDASRKQHSVMTNPSEAKWERFSAGSKFSLREGEIIRRKSAEGGYDYGMVDGGFGMNPKTVGGGIYVRRLRETSGFLSADKHLLFSGDNRSLPEKKEDALIEKWHRDQDDIERLSKATKRKKLGW